MLDELHDDNLPLDTKQGFVGLSGEEEKSAYAREG